MASSGQACTSKPTSHSSTAEVRRAEPSLAAPQRNSAATIDDSDTCAGESRAKRRSIPCGCRRRMWLQMVVSSVRRNGIQPSHVVGQAGLGGRRGNPQAAHQPAFRGPRATQPCYPQHHPGASPTTPDRSARCPLRSPRCATSRAVEWPDCDRS